MVLGLAAAVTAGLIGLSGCSASPPAASPVSAGPSPGPGTAASPPDPVRDEARCRKLATALGSARSPIDAMRTEPVLGPFIALIELGPRQLAEQGSVAGDPSVASGMREVVSAIDELDAQARAALPPGADPTSTTVKLNPDRLAAALDGVERACAPLTR